MNRRQMLSTTLAVGSAAAFGSLYSTAFAQAKGNRRFTMDLCGGKIGVKVDQLAMIELAHRYGFESVEPNSSFLAKQSNGQLQEIAADLKSKKLVWGAAGLPVQFREDDTTFRNDIDALPDTAAKLQQAGVTRVATWLSPTHADLTYMANFRRHAERLRTVARILEEHDLRFGLEYVGPKTLWSSKTHPFVHTMAETKDLIGEIGQGNVGFLLDSWHWYTAHETRDDLLTLTNDDVVAVDLNDAPAGIPVDEQIDNRRELPSATGVIDLKTFLGALVEIDYDGPVRSEPFNQPLNNLDDEPAVEATANAMKKSFALI